MTFSRALRQRSRTSWDLICGHPFVQAIGDGTLSVSRFRYFMRQDYLFLIEYARVLAMAAGKAPDLTSMTSFAALLSETLNSEMALHRSMCGDYGITARQLALTRPAGATARYTQFLVDVATNGGIEEICAALLPCQWSYDEIGRSLAGSRLARPGSFHRRWINGYNSPEYRAVTEWLVGFVDRIGPHARPSTQSRMHELFEESCRHELRFWESAWRLGRA
ncbi:MAG: thiaminase II [Chloroflexi bacterium]|nr:thiaminase II [Chloroflexota bacterium]